MICRNKNYTKCYAKKNFGVKCKRQNEIIKEIYMYLYMYLWIERIYGTAQRSAFKKETINTLKQRNSTIKRLQHWGTLRREKNSNGNIITATSNSPALWFAFVMATFAFFLPLTYIWCSVRTAHRFPWICVKMVEMNSFSRTMRFFVRFALFRCTYW